MAPSSVKHYNPQPELIQSIITQRCCCPEAGGAVLSFYNVKEAKAAAKYIDIMIHFEPELKGCKIGKIRNALDNSVTLTIFWNHGTVV